MTNTPIHTHPDDRSELLSGYLDRALDVAEQRQAERTVAECAACAEELADLRSLQTMLRALPAPMPRRSFTIDPATVRPRRLWFPIFRFASLAAAVLLFVTVGIGFTQGSPGQSTASVTTMTERKLDQAAPAAGGAMDETYSQAGQAEPTLQAPAAAMAQPEAAMPASTEVVTAAEAPVASNPVDVTAVPESAAGASTDVANATAVPESAAVAEAPADNVTTAEADAPVGAMRQSDASSSLAPREESTTVAGEVELLQESDSAAADTAQLTTTSEAYSPPINLWHILAYVLAVFVVGLGGAWWWTARRGI